VAIKLRFLDLFSSVAEHFFDFFWFKDNNLV